MNQVIQDVKDLSELPWVSSSMTERLSASGDTTGIPYYHYRWKKKWLADYVAWPTSAEQVSMILKFASKKNIPVVPRGGGTCYYGSASPTRGGIILDTKALDAILRINEEELWVDVQSGIVWEVLDRKLERKGLSLKVTPQSAPASTLGGWLSIGGKAGIGTPKFGTMLDNIQEMTVVRPNGTIEVVTGEKMKPFFGTSGIAGVVVSMKLKIRRKPERIDGVMYAFETVEKACEASRWIGESSLKPVYLRITDLEYEWRIQGGLPPHPKNGCFVLVTYDGANEEVEQGIKLARSVLESSGGFDVGKSFYEKNWEDRFIIEMKLKLEVPTLSMQNFLIEPSKVSILTKKMYSIAKKYRINSCFYAVLGANTKFRFCAFAPSDHRHWMHFMSGKSMLHHLVKEAYRNGAKLYTLGLQNTVYLKKYQPEDYKLYRQLRDEWDPQKLMNPDKLTNANMTYRRLNLMFSMNGRIRRLMAIFRIAKNILQVPEWVKEEK
ncbi:MAG: FAD-binding oxidoreductase [Candidatus Thorarchaeota archaeon]